MEAHLDHGPSDPEPDSAFRDGGSYDANSAMRLWLVRGVHSTTVDPRRRAGSHGLVRRLLVADHPSAERSAGGLHHMISALQRQVLHNSLAELEALERQIVTLAYLEGRTNRQIAEHLGVSVTTVKRRLWSALGRLEQYLAASGAWLASILLVGLAFLTRWPRTARHLATVLDSEWLQPVAATVATGLVAVSVVGLVIAESERPPVTRHAAPVTMPGPAPAAAAIAGITPVAAKIDSATVSLAAAAVTVQSDETAPQTRKTKLHRHPLRHSLGASNAGRSH